MCIKPTFVWVERGPGHQKQPIPCKRCWQCRSNHVNDYVGRSLAEAAVSEWTVALTLTYANDEGSDTRADLAHVVLTPLHFQQFIRALRDDASRKKTGTVIRYLVAGEYGSTKGRAHFHCIIFGKGPRPDWPQGENFQLLEWPHGHSFADWAADDKAVRYVCKYLQKPDYVTTSWFSCSKKPQLGYEWFMSKAREAGSLGVMPSSFNYLPPGGRRNYPYLMRGATRRDYFLEIVRNLPLSQKEIRARLGEWTLKSFDKIQLNEMKKAATYPPTEAFLKQFGEELELARPSDRSVQSSIATTSRLSHEDKR